MGSSALARGIGVVVGVALLAGGAFRYATRTRPVVLTFEGRVGALPFACDRAYAGLGATRATVKFEDFRLYVHDVRVLTDAGETAMTLDEDGTWQNAGLALLDFEGPGCGGNDVTRTTIVGTVPARTPPITGVRFVLGVPADLDHLDAATNPSPRNLSAMYWGWEAGYKYLRIEGRSEGNPAGFRYHLGASGCTARADGGGDACAEPNLASVTLPAFDPRRQSVVVDLASLFAEADLDAARGRGCMGNGASATCAPFFAALGLGASTGQRLFRAGESP